MPKKPKDQKEKREGEEKDAKARTSSVDKEAEQAAAEELGKVEQEQWDPDEFLRKKLLNRKELLDQRDYFGLIHNLPESTAPPENYAKHWSVLLNDRQQKESREKIALLEKALSGKILIDLGGGKGEHLRGDGVYEKAIYSPPAMQEVARKLRAKIYVNVDRYHTDLTTTNLLDVTDDIDIEQPLSLSVQVSYVQGDMLEFLHRMSDHTPEVVLVLNGIDTFVIQDHEYRKVLAEEIARVMPPGGTVLTCGSEDITVHLEKLGFEVAEGFPENGWPAYPQLWIKK